MCLEVGVPQIIVNYPDNWLPWHHRLLLLDLGGGKGIGATPDCSVQVGDLSTLSDKIVVCNADFQPTTGNIYGLDPLTDQDTLQLKSETQLMASVMGENTAAPNGVIDAATPFADVACEGFNGQAGIAVEHSVIGTTSSLAIGYDSLNVLNLAFIDRTCTGVLMIERAVKRNPRAPDFEGLEMFLDNGCGATGGVTTRDFDKHIAETQMNDAMIMKQSRLCREEHTAEEKTKKESKGTGKDKGE